MSTRSERIKALIEQSGRKIFFYGPLCDPLK